MQTEAMKVMIDVIERIEPTATIHADHDQITIDGLGKRVPTNDKRKLVAHDWFYDDDVECWTAYT